jgi:hypothetical protein
LFEIGLPASPAAGGASQPAPEMPGMAGLATSSAFPQPSSMGAPVNTGGPSPVATPSVQPATISNPQQIESLVSGALAPAGTKTPTPPPMQPTQGAAAAPVVPPMPGAAPLGGQAAQEAALAAAKAQQDVTANAEKKPADVSAAASQDRDKEFATVWNNYTTSGGQATVDNANQILKQVIQDLKDQKLKTGTIASKLSINSDNSPSDLGRFIDPDVLNSINTVNSTVFPSLKALFGARVTNTELNTSLATMGLNASKNPLDNIQQIERLGDKINYANDALNKQGQYFDKHGTLAGYVDPVIPDVNDDAPQPAQSKAITQADIDATVKASGRSQDEVIAALKQKGYQLK